MTPRAYKIAVGLGLGLAVFGGPWLLGSGSAAKVASARQAEIPTTLATVPAGAGMERPGVVPTHRPEGYQPKVDTGLRDHLGNVVGVSCATCHTTRLPNRDAGLVGVMPKDFHQGLKYAHADQSCLSCHHAENYDTLRLADGRALPFAQAQQLCAQCHGPQTRDYLHGSHGGMTGYWDKTKGPRSRNTCTDCHDPHAPAYPALAPIFAPRDAGARQQAEREAAHALKAALSTPSHD
jgi:hypothetical protein